MDLSPDQILILHELDMAGGPGRRAQDGGALIEKYGMHNLQPLCEYFYISTCKSGGEGDHCGVRITGCGRKRLQAYRSAMEAMSVPPLSQ